MPDNLYQFRSQQIAILGSSGDLATTEELGLAEACGLEIARRGLTLIVGGDDGVMGAAARASKNYGGTTVAIIPRDKAMSATWIFDSIVHTGLAWIQFSDVIIKSCSGALVIGGGAGTLGELAMLYLAGTPGAFIGSASRLAQQFSGHPLDSRGLGTFPVFDTPADGLDYIISHYKSTPTDDPQHLLHVGWEIHLGSYPFNTSGDYLEAAQWFRQASVFSFPRSDPDTWKNAMAHYWDALGDHFYYHKEDHLQAATYYVRALLHSQIGASIEGDASFSAYLRAIALESTAYGLRQIGEVKLAKVIIEQAARYYEAAISLSPPNDHQFLKHSSVALYGEAYYFEAIVHFEDGRIAEARKALVKARELYEAALRLAPSWGNGLPGDNYADHIQQIADLEVKFSGVS